MKTRYKMQTDMQGSDKKKCFFYVRNMSTFDFTVDPSSVLHEEGNSWPGDTRVMNSSLFFAIINERGGKEDGVGVGVEREVYSLLWKQFTKSMTIGERKRVPLIRHDHFIKEWEAVGRILVKGYQSVSYFPLFLSKAFICYCLFDAKVIIRYEKNTLLWKVLDISFPLHVKH